MNQISRWTLTAAVCVLLFAILAGIKFSQIKEAIEFAESFPEPSARVEAIRTQPTMLRQQFNTVGTIIAPEAMVLRNELDGRITAVNVEAGQHVAKGQVLVELDHREELARLEAARARVTLAQLELERIQTLEAQKTVSRESLDRAQAEHKIARAEIETLLAIIDKKAIKAPFAATVGLHDLEVGDYLSANDELFSLQGDRDDRWVDFSIPTDRASMQPGTPVRVYPNDKSGQFVDAVLISRNPTVTESSRSVKFRARIDEAAALPDGALVKLSIETGQAPAFTLPSTSVLKDALGDYVFLLEKDEQSNAFRARRQSVSVIRQDDLVVYVNQGVNEGNLVATLGAFKLREGLLTFTSSPGDALPNTERESISQ